MTTDQADRLIDALHLIAVVLGAVVGALAVIAVGTCAGAGVL